jgi:signal transduction histidine kinase
MQNQLALKTDQRFFKTVLNGSVSIVAIGTMTSWIAEQPFFEILVHVISLLVYLLLRISVEKTVKRYSFFVHFYLIYTTIALGAVYFDNGGIDGPIAFIFLSLIQAGFLITSRIQTYWFAIAIPIFVGLLYTLEFFFPSLVTKYATTEARNLDNIISTISLLAITVYLSYSGIKWIAKEREENDSKTKELEEAHSQTLAALKTREDFLSVMSHEVRTPLNAVLGFSQLLQQTDLNKEQKELNQHILNGGEQLLELMNQVLDYSRLQKSLNQAKLEECDLVATISKACNLHQPRLTEKQLECVTVFDLNLPARLSLDRPRFLQILNNLISNSIKFMDSGLIRVSVKMSKDNRLIFDVEDSGLGISEDHLQRIFEPFEQVDSSLSRNFDGAGLGLAVCKKNAEIMQGELSVQSKVGVGSIFTLNIPLISKSSSIREFYHHPFGFDSYYVPKQSPELTRFCLWLDEFGCGSIEDQSKVSERTVIIQIDKETADAQELLFYSDSSTGKTPAQNIHLGMFLNALEELSIQSNEERLKQHPSTLAPQRVLVVDWWRVKCSKILVQQISAWRQMEKMPLLAAKGKSLIWY